MSDADADAPPPPPPSVARGTDPATGEITDHVTCLGCGCACDDISVVVRAGKITEARNACRIGTQWFGDGVVPNRVRVGGQDATIDRALEAAADTLGKADGVLVYVADDVSCEAQRAAIAIADMLHGTLDSATSSTVASGILAAQRRGRAGASLGEIRNRADVVVFWGVNLTDRYPRFAKRYAPDPEGLFIPLGRSGRTVIAVTIGAEHDPSDADFRVTFSADEEVAAQGLTRAAILGRAAPNAAPDSLDARTAALASKLMAGKYVALIADAEPIPGRDTSRAEGMLAIAESLNASTRCALITLRAGGNRVGVDAVLTWQTGYPMAVDFARGYPRYVPSTEGATDRIAGGKIAAALVVGSSSSVPDAVRGCLADVRCVVVGPRASESTLQATVAIDTGVAGIHEGGMAFRTDEIPLRLRPALSGARSAAETLLALAATLARHPSRTP